MKNAFAIFFIILCCGIFQQVYAQTTCPEGTSLEAPFLIESEQDFNMLIKDSCFAGYDRSDNKILFVKLVNDIELSQHDQKETWLETMSRVVFLGNGKAIKNFKRSPLVDKERQSWRKGCYLFSSIYKSEISSLKLENINYKCQHGDSHVGALAARIENSKITDTHVSGKILLINPYYHTGSGSSTLKVLGGLAARVELSEIKGSSSNIDFTVGPNLDEKTRNHGQLTAGGLIGLSIDTQILDSVARGKMQITTDGGSVGGLVGDYSGDNESLVKNYSAEVDMKIKNYSPYGIQIAGFLGILRGNNSNSNMVLDSYAKGNIKVSGIQETHNYQSPTAIVGGFIAYTEKRPSIFRSFYEGNINVESSIRIHSLGGFIANADRLKTIEDSYALAAISIAPSTYQNDSGQTIEVIGKVGGFIGELHRESLRDPRIKNIEFNRSYSKTDLNIMTSFSPENTLGVYGEFIGENLVKAGKLILNDSRALKASEEIPL